MTKHLLGSEPVRQEVLLPAPHLWITSEKCNYLVSSDSNGRASWIVLVFLCLMLTLFFNNVIFMLIIPSFMIANTSGQLSHSPNDSRIASRSFSQFQPHLWVPSDCFSRLAWCIFSFPVAQTELWPLPFSLCVEICRSQPYSFWQCGRLAYQAWNLPVILDTFLCLPSLHFYILFQFPKLLDFKMVFNSKGKSDLEKEKENHF